jgi:isoamyl acetate esterase
MKHAILIGDSIRLHYQSVVIRLLAPHIQVWAPAENCETSRTVLQQLDAWVLAHDPDLIHLNCGLHDLRYNPDRVEPLVSPDEYADNLDRIFATVRAKTHSRVIWATTTPINEQWHQAHRQSRRYEADVIRYNTLARQVAADHHVLMNDLYQVVIAHGRDALLREDGLHFTAQGYQLLGQQVAAVIRQVLATDTHP